MPNHKASSDQPGYDADHAETNKRLVALERATTSAPPALAIVKQPAQATTMPARAPSTPSPPFAGVTSVQAVSTGNGFPLTANPTTGAVQLELDIPAGAQYDTLYYPTSTSIAASAFSRNDGTHVYFGTATDYSRIWVPLSGVSPVPAPQIDFWTGSAIRSVCGYDSSVMRFALFNVTANIAFCGWDTGKLTIGNNILTVAGNEIIVDPTAPLGIGTTFLHAVVATFFEGAHKDSSGTAGGTAVTGGVTFSEGLYISGTIVSGSATTDSISGLNLKWKTTTTLDVGTGTAYVPLAAAAVTVSAGFTVNPAAGTGIAGGGTITLANNTRYFVHLVTASTVEITTATPTNYQGTAWESAATNRYIGMFLTDGSAHIINFRRDGDEVLWKADTESAPFLLVSTTHTGGVFSQSCSALVPNTCFMVIMNVSLSSSANVSSVGFGTSDGVTPTTSAGSPFVVGFDFGMVSHGAYHIPLDGSQTFTLINVSTTNGMRLSVLGYRESR